MSENRLDNPQRGPNCSCGGITWERLDSTGYYYQCEECGECVDTTKGKGLSMNSGRSTIW